MKSDKLSNAYRVLGLGEDAGARELKKVFHEKAALYHPDTNPSPAAAEEFKTITQAYDIIKDHLKKVKKTGAPRAGGTQATGIREPNVRVGDTACMLPVAELMFRVANSENKYVRVHAIRGLAAQGGREAAWCLVKSLGDGDVEVRREAAAALGRLRARFAVAPLINLYRNSLSDPETLQTVNASLREINSPMARGFLSTLAREIEEIPEDDDSFSAGDIA